MTRIRARSREDTIEIGKALGSRLQPGSILALAGGLAAGKTTLSKGIALGLGVEEEVTSPTFTLISTYEGRIPLYHMDMYRLGGSEEFLALGAEELLYGGGVCILEWSERVAEVLPPSTIRVALEPGPGDEERYIEISASDPGLEQDLVRSIESALRAASGVAPEMSAGAPR